MYLLVPSRVKILDLHLRPFALSIVVQLGPVAKSESQKQAQKNSSKPIMMRQQSREERERERERDSYHAVGIAWAFTIFGHQPFRRQHLHYKFSCIPGHDRQKDKQSTHVRIQRNNRNKRTETPPRYPLPRRSHKQVIRPDSIQYALSPSHSLTISLIAERAGERARSKTEAGKGKMTFTTTQQPNAANAWIIKLGNWKRKTNTKKPTKTTLGFVFHKNSSTIMRAFCTNDTKSSLLLFPSSSSSCAFACFFFFFSRLVPSGAGQYFLFFFFFVWWVGRKIAEKSPKNDTVFWKWNIFC